ncbi:MAG TPA: hypothetical protein ENO27_01920 [Caldithrix sp.]|nr:hypothetical protein [Caldithrix sp.]HES59210.1 hypothetical protein [Caldithrix sp.]
MKHLHFLITLVFLFSIILSCQQTPDFEKEKAELLAWHKKNMQAIVDGDIETMVLLFPDSSLAIDNGEVVKFDKEKDTERLKKDFARGKFIETPDLIEPIIHISNDATMAWMLCQYHIKYIFTDSTGVQTDKETVGSEISVFEKINSKWVFSAGAETYQKPADK